MAGLQHLVIIEANGKAQKIRSLISALQEGKSKGTQPAIAKGGTFRVIATGGHFRSVVEATPYFEPPRGEELKPVRSSPNEADFLEPQIKQFLEGNPPATPVTYTIVRPNGWNPDPEANPARYIGIAAPVPEPLRRHLSQEVQDRAPYEPWFMMTSQRVYRELRQAVNALAPDGVIYIATDDDEEGEGIGWHLLHVIHSITGKAPNYRRVRYSAVTLNDLREGFVAADQGDRIRMGLVYAQQTRDKLDRIIGFMCSRAIWPLGRMPGGKALSLGRVQLAAMTLLLEADEKVLQALPKITYSIQVDCKKGPSSFKASWSDQQVLAGMQDKQALSREVSASPGRVASYSERVEAQARLPMFDLDTLQDVANSVYNMSAKKVLDGAAFLYQQALTSYPRSDSTQISLTTLGVIRRMVSTLGETSEGPIGWDIAKANVVHKQNKGEQAAHEAIHPLPTKVSDAWIELLREEAKGRKTSLQTIAKAIRASGRGFTGHVQVIGGNFGIAMMKGVSLDEVVQIYDLILRRSLAALFPAAEVKVQSVTLHHDKLPTLNNKPLPLTTGAKAFVSRQGYAVFSFPKITNRVASGGSLPPMEPGDSVKMTLRPANIKTTVKAESRPTIQQYVRKRLKALGIGRPSSTADALETLEKRGYVRPMGEERHGMTRFGAFVTGLARSTFRASVSLHTTALMDQAASLLRDDEGEQLPTNHIRVLNLFYNSRFFDELRQTRETSLTLGNLSGPGLSSLVGFFPSRGPGEDFSALSNSLNAITQITATLDEDLDELLAEPLVFEYPTKEDTYTVKIDPTRWNHWGSLRYIALPRDEQGTVIVVWKTREGYRVRAYHFYENPEIQEEEKRLLAFAKQMRKEASRWEPEWADEVARQYERMARSEGYLRNRALFFTLKTPLETLIPSIQALMGGLAFPLHNERRHSLTYLESWDVVLEGWRKIRRLYGRASLDTNGVFVDTPRYMTGTSVYSLLRRANTAKV